MRNNTLGALILRHGDNLLRRPCWPERVGSMQVAPGVVPGWLAGTPVRLHLYPVQA